MATNITSSLTLTEEFQCALDLLEDGSHLFLTGKAGTGKSTLIRLFAESTHKNIVVAAPTGVAALNVDGYTLHRLFSFPPGVTPGHVRSNAYYPRRFSRTIKTLDTLIIDEASMVRADLFDSLATALDRFGPKPGTLFGGVQIILVGDLYQLPPVVTETEQDYFSSVYSSPFFFAANAYAQTNFPTVELTTIFRQDGDPEFVSILNSIRDGQATPKSVEQLNKHVNEEFRPPADEFWLTLTARNSTADKRNREKLALLATQQFTSTASATGEIDGFEKPTQSDLDFKIGAQIMLLTNDPQGRWVNGSLAVITGIKHKDGDYSVEVELRNNQRHLVESHTWEITRPSFSGGALTHEVIGTYRQLPFRLAWAVTVHKAQGLTLDRCVIDLTGGAFAAGQLYVALSRARSLEGLVLARPVRPRDLRVSQEIRRFHHTHDGGSQGEHIIIAMNYVGDEGFNWRPRPIELAIISPDGTELTTLVNPQRDIGNSITTLGISAEDVVLAPTLPLAWAALSPHLAGRIPVGFDLDEALGFIDFELKRHDHIIQIPTGIEIKTLATRRVLQQLEQSLSALDKARIIKRFLEEAGANLPAATAFQPIEPRFGYLLPRGPNHETQFMLKKAHTKKLAQYLGSLEHEAKNSARLSSTLETVQSMTGHAVLTENKDLGQLDISEVLVPGAAVCFTGEAQDPRNGMPIERSTLEALATEKGLQCEPSVTKSRTASLIVAEFGTQSGKAKKARQWNKPIFSVEEYINWVIGKNTTPSGTVDVNINVMLLELPEAAAHVKGNSSDEGTNFNTAMSSEPDTLTADQPSITHSVTDPREKLAIPWSAEPIEKYLVKGTVVAATGIIYDHSDNRRIIQDELAQKLAQYDLCYARSLNQQRTTLLLVGEISKITRQISNAIKFNKPIFPAADFLAWISEQELLIAEETNPGGPETLESATVERLSEVTDSPPPPVPTPSQARHTSFPSVAVGQMIHPANVAAPRWARIPARIFYGVSTGVPFSLALVLPIIFMIFSLAFPSTETIMTGLAAISMVFGFIAVPIALVFVGLRIKIKRRLKTPNSYPQSEHSQN